MAQQQKKMRPIVKRSKEQISQPINLQYMNNRTGKIS